MKLELKDILIILLLLFVIKNETCNNSSSKVVSADTTRTIATVVIKDSTSHNGNSISTKEIVPYIINTSQPQYIPSNNYDDLKLQFTKLRDELLETKIKEDSAKLGSYGTVYITDSIQNNDIQGRKIKYNLQIPKETITIKEPAKLKNQWLVGASVQGNKQTPINQVSVELLMVNKKNKAYKIQTGIDNNGNVNYGVGAYIKL